jgi:hypothetical protein
VTRTTFEVLQAKDRRKERRVLWSEILVIALLALLVAVGLIFAS